MQETAKTNIAPKSGAGHYVQKAKQVICLDNVKEAFFVEGSAVLTTEKHETLPMEENCFITPQQVYNPYSKSMERSKD